MQFIHQLISTHDHILVAVSGGKDSMALLHLLQSLVTEKQLTLTVAHFNHQIRGANALRDAEFVQGYAAKNNLPCILGMKDVPAYANEYSLSLEDAARICRYQFLKKTGQDIGATKIALAHNHNDQTETIIMRFLRGTGSKGLCGMPETRLLEGLPLIRPLLKTLRNEIEAYVQNNSLAFQHDETNDEIIFMRNKLRHTIIPNLKEINPNLDETISRMAEIFTDEEQYWETLSIKTYENLIITSLPNEIKLDSHSLHNHPKALQRRVIRKAIATLQGSLNTISLLYIENFLENKLNTIYINEQGKLEGKKV